MSDFRDYFNTRLNQELERSAQVGIPLKYQEVQEAAAHKTAMLKQTIVEGKQRELAAANSWVGKLGLDPDGLAGTAVNLGASLYTGASRLAGDITGFVAGDLEAMLRDGSITEQEKQAISRVQTGQGTPGDLALVNAPRPNGGYSPMEQAQRAAAARERSQNIDSAFDRSDTVHQGRREALHEQLGANFQSAWDQVTSGAKALWTGEGQGRATGATDLTMGVAKLIYNAGEAAVTNPGAAAEYVAENIPQLGLGLLGQGGRAAMLASNVGYASENYQKGIAKYQAENNGAYPPEAERMQMAAAAASLALAEHVGDTSLLKGAKAASEATTSFKQSLLNTAKATAGGVASEAATEGYQTWAEGVATRTPATAQQIYEGAVIGGITGGGLSGGGRAAAEVLQATPEHAAQAAREVATREAKEAAQTVAISTGDVSALVDPKNSLYAPEQAVAALAGHSAQPDATEEVRQANLEKATQIVADLEERAANTQALYESYTPEGVEKSKGSLAQAEAAGSTELVQLLQDNIAKAEAIEPSELRSLKVQADSLGESLVQARENLTRFSTEVAAAKASTEEMGGLVASLSTPVDTSDVKAVEARTKQADQVINLSMASPERLAPEVAKSLAQDTTNGLTQPQRNYLRQFAAARVMENRAKDIGLVQKQIFTGGKGFIGLTQHRERIAAALAAGNQKLADRHLGTLRAFEADHLAKAKTAVAGWNRGMGTQIVKADGQWAIHSGDRMSDAQIAKNGGLTLNSEGLVKAVGFEARAITAALRELEAAHALKFKTTNKVESEGVNRVEDVPQAPSQAEDAAASNQASQAAGSAAEASTGGAEPSSASVGPGSAEVERPGVEQQPTQSNSSGAEGSTQSTEYTSGQAELTTSSVSPEETSEDAVDTATADVREDKTKDEGRLSVFDHGDDTNLVAKGFKQQASKEGDATKRPLVAAKNVLGALKDRAQEFLTQPLDDKQKEALGTFLRAAKTWFPSIQKNLVRKDNKEFWHEDMIQFLLQEESGKLDLDENVKTAMAYAAFSFVAENATRPELNSDEEINAILNREETAQVSEDERAVLGRIGTRQNVVINDLGQRVVDALGLRVAPSASLDLMPRLVQSLGAHVWKLLLDEGVISRTTLTAEEMSNISGEPVKAGQEKTQYQFIKLAREDRKLNSVAQAIFEANRGSQSVIDKLFGVEPGLKDPSLEPIPFGQQAIRNTRQGVPGALAKIIEHENKQPNYLRQDMWQVFTLMDPDLMLEIAGAKHIDSTTMHKVNRLAVEAKNDGLIREMENFKDYIELVIGKAKEGLDTPMYFPHVVWKQQRVGIGSNTVNPQTSKIHRHMLYRPTWKTTIDPTNDEQMTNFRLRVAEGLGVKTDKTNQAKAFEDLETKLADPRVPVAVAALRKALAGEGISKEEQQAIADGVKAGGEKMHSLDALVALAQESSDKPFEVALMGEVDGVTNGPMLSHLLLGAAESSDELFQLLNRGGFYAVGSDVDNYNVWRSQPGHVDLYENTARGMEKNIQDLINTGITNKWGKVTLSGEMVKAVTSSIYSFTGELVKDGTVVKAGRDIVKTPLTAMVFGSATSKAVDSMANKFVESIYDGIEKSATGKGQSREQLLNNINQLLAVGRGPSLSNRMTIEQLMEHEFTSDQVKALKSAFTQTVGVAVRATMETDFAPFIARRKQFNEAAQLTHGLYDAVYTVLRGEILKDLTAKGEVPSRTNKAGEAVPLHDLTKSQEAVVRKELAKALPVMHTYFSKQSRSLRSGISISKSGRKLSQEDTYAQEIKFGTKTPDGKARVNTHGYEVRETGPGVAMVPMSVHSSDSAISHLAAMLGEVLNVHDAHGSGIGGFQKTAQNLNQATWQVLLEYSPAREMFDALARTVTGLASLERIPAEALANINNLLEKLGGEEPLTLEGALKQMHQVAHAADTVKLQSMSQLQSIDQYALEGGHYVVTDEDRAKATSLLGKLDSDPPAEVMEAAASLTKLLTGETASGVELDVEVEPSTGSAFGALGSPATVDEGLVKFFEANPEPILMDVLKQLYRSINAKGEGRINAFQLDLVRQLVKSVDPLTKVKLITPQTKVRDVLEMPKQASMGWFVSKDGKQETYVLSEAFTNSGLQSTETLLHELMHAAVAATVDAAEGDVKPLVQELEVLMAKSKEVPSAAKYGDALNSVQEFIAYGMTNEAFQREVLSQIQMPSKTVKNTLVSGFRSFIDTLVGILFKGTKKAQQEIMANGVVVMVQNVAGLLNQAQQQRGAGRTLNLSQAVQSFTTLDIHNALNGDGLSVEFATKLSELLSGMVEKLHGPFGAFKADVLQRTSAAATPEAVWEKAQDTGAAPLALSVRASPIVASEKELHAMEQVEATVRAALSSGDVAARVAYRELDNLFTEMRAAIKPSEFGSQAEHDFIFKVELDASGKSNHLARFAAFALAHEGFNLLMQRSTAPRARARDGKTFAQRVQTVFENILSFFAERLTNTYTTQRADRKLQSLVSQLVDIEAKKRLAIARAAAAGNPSLLGNAEKLVASAGDKVREAVAKAAGSDLIRNSSNTFVKLGGSLVRLQANDQVEFLLRTLGEFRDKHFPGLHGLPTELLNQVKGMGQTLNLLQLMSTNSQRQRKHIITQTSKAAIDAFSQKLGKKDRAIKAAISQVFMRTGMHALLDHFSMIELENLLRNPNILAQEIEQTEAELKELSAGFADQFIHQANALGYFRVTGLVKHQRLMMNAHNIARLYGTAHANRITEAQASAVQPTIERLVALYAMEYVSEGQKNKALEIFRVENDREHGNGVEFVLRLHRKLEQESADRIFRNQPALMMHGYTPEIYNPGTVVAVANEEDGKDLMYEGYTKGALVQVDPADPLQENRHLYVLKDGGLARFQTGIVSYSGMQAKGSKKHSGYLNVNTTDGLDNASMNADIAAAKPAGLARGRRPDLRNEKATFLAPIVNPQGDIVNWRYLMADTTKDSIMERDNRFENILGVLAGSIFDKESTAETNTKTLEALKEIYQGERHTHASSFVLVGPNSPDAQLREIWSLLPEATKAQARGMFTRDGLYVKKEMLLPVFGYRSYSLADAFKKDPAARGTAEKYFVEVVEWVLATNARINAKRKGLTMNIEESRKVARKAAILITRGEKVWQELVHEVKDIIVVKSIKVMVDNILSNWSYLVLSGVPLKDILRHHLVAMRAARSHETDTEELDQLQLKVSTGQAPANAAQEIARLKDALARNPVRELIDAGLMPTIVEDVAADDESDPYTYKSQLMRKAERFTDKLNPGVVSAAKFIYMAHDTKLYQGLSRLTRMSDFLARYTLYQYLVNQKTEDGNAALSRDEAIHEASEAFVNYDSPLPKGLQYLDQMGLVPFTKYYLRIQRVLTKLIRKNPARVISALLLDNFVNLGPIVLDSSWIHRFGNNPFQWGALQLPGTIDELGTIATASALLK